MSQPAATYPLPTSPIGNIASLHNKVALITGGSSGLGRCIAQAYSAAGAYIVSADLKETPALAPVVETALKTEGSTQDFSTPTVELINANWPAADEGRKQRAVFFKVDVTDEESVKAAVKFAVDTYGRLDIMVNNAGTFIVSLFVSIPFFYRHGIAFRSGGDFLLSPHLIFLDYMRAWSVLLPAGGYASSKGREARTSAPEGCPFSRSLPHPSSARALSLSLTHTHPPTTHSFAP